MRIFKTLAIVIGMYFVALVVDVALVLGSADYQGGVTVVVLLGFLAFLAPKVGYRWFDCFFAAIPFYGIYFIFKIAYRTAHLPERDWAERSAS
jgi:hypothetical protein